MNRKIFTLFAGALLMLVAVFSANAQSAITQMPLQLGPKVDKLNLGGNDYYHLVVTDVARGGTKTAISAFTGNSNTYVLYMGTEQTNRTFPVFIAELGYGSIYAPSHPSTPGAPSYWAGTKGWFPLNAPKTQESASSLWCTVVNEYDQGQNITFDFINKEQTSQMLEVNVDGYYGWKTLPDITGLANPADHYYTNGTGSIYVPGTISGWNFSSAFKTYVEERKPLFSYIKSDTVAVLCTNVEEMASSTPPLVDGAYIFIKIASIDDVLNDRVPGMLYFTLHQAAPFALSAQDFNTLFAQKPDNHAGGTSSYSVSLIFDGDASGTNPFSKPVTTNTGGALWAEHITYDAGGANNYTGAKITQVRSAASGAAFTFFDSDFHPFDYGVPAGNITNEGLWGSGTTFDELGYMYLKRTATTTNEYLYVKHDYYDGNKGGDQFLQFGFRRLENTQYGNPDWADSTRLYDVLYPQTIWRLIYYPSGDSIYINPYQATYLPTHSDKLMTRSTDPGIGGFALQLGEEVKWTDPLAQSSDYYTFRAAITSLEASGNAYERMTSRLRYKRLDPTSTPLPHPIAFYDYFHRNYVTIQNLTGNTKIVTLGNGTFASNHEIDTRIHAGKYIKCAPGSSGDRTTVKTDLYLIRSIDAQKREWYLHVPLYSANDSAVWSVLEPDVHPEFLPSYQWAVIKRHENSESSQVSIINREFDHMRFENIQLLSTKMDKFDIPGGYKYKWNSRAVNSKEATLANSSSNDATFIAIPDYIKKDTLLGYEYINPDTAQINVYSLNFSHGIDASRYISWKGSHWNYPDTDTTVYVLDKYSSLNDNLYFKLKPAKSYPLTNFGITGTEMKRIKDLAQLKRQPYYLDFEDPYKFMCASMLWMLNGIQDEYIMGTDGDFTYMELLGIPIFNLRHVYHKGGDQKQPFFALLQRLNKDHYSTYTNDRLGFRDFLISRYGLDATRIIMGQIPDLGTTHHNNDYFSTGAFVARVDDQTAKLKVDLRADQSQVVSTFRLVRDDDPLYRRFNTTAEADEADDTPKVLKFFWMDNPSYELFENTGALAGHKAYYENYGIGTVKTPGGKNYLGAVNTNQYPKAPTAIYVDTAFINRGTGPIKPQYMLLVDPQWPEEAIECDDEGKQYVVSPDYIRGRYLINATDSARGVGAGVKDNSVAGPVIPGNTQGVLEGRNYLWNSGWERFVFTDAIHVYEKDALYLVAGVAESLYTSKTATGQTYVDLTKLDNNSQTNTAATTTTGAGAKPIRKIPLGNNDHKDVVFSMRLIQRGSPDKDFFIESESSDRIFGDSYGRKNSSGIVIAPCEGGWVKISNGPGEISRSIQDVTNIPQGMRFNVRKTDDYPSANDKVTAAAVTVIGGNNVVTILGAAGKSVVITNILGQTVANAVLTTDNAVINAPKGVVVVAVEGKAPVKTLVK